MNHSEILGFPAPGDLIGCSHVQVLTVVKFEPTPHPGQFNNCANSLKLIVNPSFQIVSKGGKTLFCLVAMQTAVEYLLFRLQQLQGITKYCHCYYHYYY